MKRIKSILALSLTTAMTLSLLACNNEGGTTTTADAGTAGQTEAQTEAATEAATEAETEAATEAETKAATEEETEAPSGEVVPLKWITVGGGESNNYAAWQEHINGYLAENIGVNIDVEVTPWGDWDNRRSVVVNTAGEYDILFTDAGRYENEIGIGAHLDITDLVQEHAKELYDYIPADYWEAVKKDGKIYSVPTFKDSSATQYLVWDKTYADELGITDDSVKELDQLTPYLQQITEKTNAPSYPLESNGVYFILSQYDKLGTGLEPLGVRFDDQEAKVVSVFEQEEIMNRLKTVHEWYNAGYINQNAATKQEANNEAKPVSSAQGWSGAAITTWGPNMGVEAVAHKIYDTIVSNETVRGSLNTVSTSSEHPEKALEFLQFVNLDTYARDSFYYGLEGDNWDYTDDGKIHKNNTDWMMAGYTQGTFFTTTQLDTDEFNQWDEVKALNEEALPSVALGFTMNTESVADQLANCLEIARRYRSELLTGTANPEEMIPQMMQELRDAGFDEIQEEAQRQLDEFVGN